MSNFAFDLYTGQIFKAPVRGAIGSNMDVPVNTVVDNYSFDNLIERLENGKLDGKLKEIAQTLSKEKDEQNPVIEIIKYQIITCAH